jgi:hypothetical protein
MHQNAVDVRVRSQSEPRNGRMGLTPRANVLEPLTPSGSYVSAGLSAWGWSPPSIQGTPDPRLVSVNRSGEEGFRILHGTVPILDPVLPADEAAMQNMPRFRRDLNQALRGLSI